MDGFEGLERELDAWRALGRTATLWWRDDDAVSVTPAVERLLAIAAETGTPVALAVMPRDADDGLRRRLDGFPLASVLQHGWGHDNHAPAGEHWEEHGLRHRPREKVLGELGEGLRRTLAFRRGLPALVPPWNKADADLVGELGSLGIQGISTWGPREQADAAQGVCRANVHVDVMHWDESRFLGAEAVAAQFLTHLSARRQGLADANEATGLMTHHGWHDEAVWRFLPELFRRTSAHPGARWIDAREAFWR